MRKSLFAAAVAVAGVLATGVAAADTAVLRIGGGSLHVQRVEDRWWTPQHAFDRTRDRNPRDDARQADIDARQARLHDRIRRGDENGRLTPREARRLHRELAGIEARQRAMEADGRLGRREHAQLQGELDELAWRLRAQLRDGERRY